MLLESFQSACDEHQHPTSGCTIQAARLLQRFMVQSSGLQGAVLGCKFQCDSPSADPQKLRNVIVNKPTASANLDLVSHAAKLKLLVAACVDVHALLAHLAQPVEGENSA